MMSLLALLLLACGRSDQQIIANDGQSYSGNGEGPPVGDDEDGENIIAKGNAVCTPPDDDNDLWNAISDEDFRNEVEDFLRRFSNNKDSTALGVRWATDPTDLFGIYSTSGDVTQVSSSDDWTQNAFGNLISSGCEVTPDIEADLKRKLDLDRDASILVFLTNDEDGSDYLVFSTYNDSCTLGAYLIHADGRNYEVMYDEQIEDACDEVETVEEIMDRVASFVGENGDKNDVEIYRPE